MIAQCGARTPGLAPLPWGQVVRSSDQLLRGRSDPRAARALGSPGHQPKVRLASEGAAGGRAPKPREGGTRRDELPRPPMMQRPPTRPSPVTHSSPWLQHKATSPGGRFLPEERLWRPEKAQEEEEAEEEEGNRRFPNTLSEGAVRGSRPSALGRPPPGVRTRAARGPLPLLRSAQTWNKVVESDWAGGLQPGPGALAAAAPAPGKLRSGRADGGRRRRRSPRRRPESQRRRRRRGGPRGCSSSREGRPSPIDDQDRQGQRPRRSRFAAPGPKPVFPTAAAAPQCPRIGDAGDPSVFRRPRGGGASL